MEKLFKAVIEADPMPVVLCDTDHTILYMNRAALERYADRGGAALVGRSLLDCHTPQSSELIRAAITWFAQSVDNNIVFEAHSQNQNKDIYTVALRDEEGGLMGYYEKHICRTPEEGRPYEALGLAD